MKQKAFVRYTKKGKIVPGSLIITNGSFPQGSSTWKEVPADLCCDEIQLRFTPTIIPLETPSLTAIGLYCNGTFLSPIAASAATTFATLQDVVDQYNPYLSGIGGVLSVEGDELILTVSQTFKNAVCPNGTLSFYFGLD